MKHIYIVLLCLFVASGISAQGLTLELASDKWPPFTDVRGEKQVASALVKEALLRINIGQRTTIMEFGAVLEGLKDGTYHGSAALWKNVERQEYLLYSDPYLTNQLILVGRRGANVTALTLDELQGKTVAIVGTYSYGEEVTGQEGITFVEGNSDQENLNKLIEGSVDYMLVDALLIEYLMEVEGDKVSDYLAIGYTPMVRKDLHFAIRKDHPSAAGIIKQFNAEIRAMIADGTYNKILQLNWIKADVDGDGQMELVLDGSKAGMSAPQNSYSVDQNAYAKTQSGNSERYYINGQIYEGWNNVPDKYKVPEVKYEDLNFSLLKIKF